MDHGHGGDGRFHQRNDDRGQDLGTVGAINEGGLVQLLGDGLDELAQQKDIESAPKYTGTSNGLNVSSQFRYLNSRNWGMMVTSPGSISVARVSIKMRSLPGQRKRAKE